MKCEMEEARIHPLDDEEIRSLLKEIWGWRVEDEFLVKSFSFDSLNFGLAFGHKVGLIASQENQFPKLVLTNEKVEVHLQTKLVEALTKNDFIFAAKVDQLFKGSSQN